jgi:hypothetical protein
MAAEQSKANKVTAISQRLIFPIIGGVLNARKFKRGGSFDESFFLEKKYQPARIP